MTVVDDLKAKIKSEVISDPKLLEEYSKDASIYQITPQLVVSPKDAEDIKQLIIFAKENKLSLTPRSGGTDMSGGAINDSIIVDITKHFNQIIEVTADHATVQPGVYYRDFEKMTLEKGSLLPCYPASRELCTMGGIAANNSAGEKTLMYGQTKDYVKQLRVILSDGNEYLFKPLNRSELDNKLAQKDFEGKLYNQIYDLVQNNQGLIQKSRPTVSKNSTGYLLWDVWDGKTFDMTKLFVGSQGTLGIITEIEYRLIKPKRSSKMLVIFINDLSFLAKLVNQILEFKPESFEAYDDYTLKVAIRFLPEVLKVFKPTHLISLAISFIPEIWMSLTTGFPKLVLLAEFTGDTNEEVSQKCLEAQQSLKSDNVQTRITTSADDAKKYWTIRRESFNLLRHHTQNLRTAPFIDDIIVSPDHLSEFLPKLRQILDQYKLTYTIATHIGNGNFHIIPLMNFSDPQTPRIIRELADKIYPLVFEYKGSMSAEHNDGMVRGPYLEKMYGKEMFNLFKQVKNIFDPENIFNPHKKTDATFEYSMDHLAKN